MTAAGGHQRWEAPTGPAAQGYTSTAVAFSPVGWWFVSWRARDTGLVSCRTHLLDPRAVRTTVQLREPQDVADVLFDAAVVRECLACLVRSSRRSDAS